jgi:MATE family multidrug resistance protein
MQLKEFKYLVYLSAPIIVAQLARTAMSFVDIVMSGHYSTDALAAVSLGSSIWFPIFVLGYGIIIMLSADVARHKAQNDADGIKESINIYLTISLLLTVPIVLLLIGAVHLLPYIGVDQQVVEITRGYVLAMAFGVPGVLVFNVFRSVLQGLEDTKVAMYISTLALLLNIPLNYMLIFGHFGMPELGAVGAGITTAVINTLSALCLVLYFYYKQAYHYYRARPSFKFTPKLKVAFWIGVPSGLAFFVEMVFLDIIAFGVAPLGTNVIAANNVMLNIATIIFTVTSGIASAATVRISALAGERDINALSSFGVLTMGLIGSISIVFGFILYVYADRAVALYTNDPLVITTAASVIILLCLFQLFDSMQAALSGILRGLHETKIVFYAPILGYWIIGIPLGFTLGLTDFFTEPMGLKGFWYGLVSGLAINSLTLFVLYRLRLKKRQRQYAKYYSEINI